MGGKTTNLTKQELDDILRFGTEELFKEELDGKEEAIHYTDEAVEQLVDRSNKGVEEKENWANDYLSSFKVASYATKDQDEEEDDVEREILVKEDNSDPAYWVKLLRHHYEQHQEDVARSLGKGKRLRKQVNYTDNGIVTAEPRDDNWDDGSGYSDYSSDDNRDDLDDDEIAARARMKRMERERERPLPPLLARVAGNIEVLGFNARQRKTFLNAIMRYGMPAQDCFNSQWLVRDLRAKTERQFKAYVALFMRHLCEPGADNSETFADGVPREGFSRQHVLTRIGVMSLIRKKIQEFETINGIYSVPEIMNGPVLPVKIKKGDLPKVEIPAEIKAEADENEKTKEEGEDVKIEKEGGKDEKKDDNIVAVEAETADKPAIKNEEVKSELDENTAAASNDIKDEKKNIKNEAATITAESDVKEEEKDNKKEEKEEKEEDDEEKLNKKSDEKDPLDVPTTTTTITPSKEKADVVISDDDDVVCLDGDIKESNKKKIKENPADRKFMFNIADGGFTELHTLWINEEKVAVPNRIYNIWHRRHDYWLLAGTVAHGYARWQDILTDQRFAIVNEPFKMDVGKGNFLEIRNKFLARRFKLLEQALVIEEQLRRAAYLNSSSLSSQHPADFDPEASETEIPLKTSTNNPVLHKVLNQLEELLSDMKSDVSRLPATLANIPPVAQRLQAAEKSILSRIATNPKNSNSTGTYKN